MGERSPEVLIFLEKYENYKQNTETRLRNYEFISFHQSYSYEDFVEGIKPVIDDNDTESNLKYEIKDGILKTIVKRALDNKDKKYALFIDEINRGNISSIFGELITLIEEDKRVDIPITGLTVKLPYSRKEFGIPSNLYIIGTMNTADRSVEALDTALRRRFSFVEMMPEYDELYKYDISGVKLGTLLKTINDRLIYLLDRDHQIGHSYFINLQSIIDLKISFTNKIIPLLKEYFYNDYEKIKMVLSKEFVEEINEDPFEDSENYEDDHKLYNIINPSIKWNNDDNGFISALKAIYEKSPQK